jgi:hypothetical protein
VKLTTHLHPVERQRIIGVISQLLHNPSWRGALLSIGKTLPLFETGTSPFYFQIGPLVIYDVSLSW